MSQTSQELPAEGFIRLPKLLSLIPISKSSIYAKVKKGEFPAPVKLSERTSAWSVQEIREWSKRLTT